ncbi:response regulator [Dyella jiangningensis]|uniref:response regulator n=1 Tax=Dyella jiangningensis TaxID=1379159 RepID=UPI0011BF7BAB|nr:response regulator [Dyella jiangningensis]
MIGPVGRVGHALEVMSRERVNGAVLDIHLGGELVYPVADALRRRRIPFVFATGYDPESIPFLYLDVMRRQKLVAWSEAAWLLFGIRDAC